MPKKFPHYKQLDSMDCGPTCLRMVAKYHGREHSTVQLRQLAEIGKDGVNMLGIAQAAERIGFRTLGVKVTLQKLIEDAPLPCIVHWGQDHFVVVVSHQSLVNSKTGNWLRNIWGGKNSQKTNYDYIQNSNRAETTVPPLGSKGLLIADPASGLIDYTKEEFESKWASTVVDGERVGVALLLEPTQRFYEKDEEEEQNTRLKLISIFDLLLPYKPLIGQLFLGMLVGSVLQLVLPFLTQSVVDTGIQTRNLSFITLVLAAQLMLFAGRMSVDFIRSWILMHISTRINLTILSDFLAKLMRLPISFFDSKQTGDIMQRIGDHDRIEQFLTGTSLSTLFSVFNLLVFSVLLATYNLTIFGVLMLFSALYIGWVVVFLKYRRQLDHKRFALASQNQSSLIQLITGIQDIKLNNAEHLKRWAWENLQVKQFKLSMKGLAIGQYQQVGALFLNEGKNIIITFIAATAVVNGQLTLGGMMAMQYVVGQMNGPIEQLIQFMQHWQDAKISLERLNEVHSLEDEDSRAEISYGSFPYPSVAKYCDSTKGIVIKNLTFTYPGAGNEPVLRNLSLTIPQGKVTAIVGTSGSGKTTLLKLLMRFYEPQHGHITVDTQHFAYRPKHDFFEEKPQKGHITVDTQHFAYQSQHDKYQSHSHWRSRCGSVMQDGFIFSDSIANNIAIGDETPDWHRLYDAVRVANLGEFITSLPLGLDTKIGMEGNGISGGQKQRILIARAVYKDPEYLFFDEATSSLDANNEAVIVNNLNEFFRGNTIAGTDLKSVSNEYGILNPAQHKKTVVVVAHRLSTVKNADQIVVLERGEIVETGTHAELVQQHGKYYELVKNQLELGD